VVGAADGARDGLKVGRQVGLIVEGRNDGAKLGAILGARVGSLDGASVCAVTINRWSTELRNIRSTIQINGLLIDALHRFC
jgi:hypothetical protein